MQPRVTFDVGTMREDIAAKGWMQSDLALAADVSHMTVTRFLRGERQTNRTAKKLAAALGYSVRRYIVRGGAATTTSPTNAEAA